MSSPDRKRIVSAQQDLVKDYLLLNLTAEEAVHTCWACFKGIDDPNHKPQRAHIISRKNGGNYEPNNFFLLCRKCHQEQPDGNSFEMQFLWLQNKESELNQTITLIENLLKIVQVEAMDQTNNSDEVLEDYYKYMASDVSKNLLKQASSKSSGLGRLNWENNVKFWLLDHFKTWYKLKKLEGNYVKNSVG